MLNESLKTTREGTARISDDVILVIAAKEISGINGVVGLYSSSKINLYKLKLNFLFRQNSLAFSFLSANKITAALFCNRTAA